MVMKLYNHKFIYDLGMELYFYRLYIILICNLTLLNITFLYNFPKQYPIIYIFIIR